MNLLNTNCRWSFFAGLFALFLLVGCSRNEERFLKAKESIATGKIETALTLLDSIKASDNDYILEGESAQSLVKLCADSIEFRYQKAIDRYDTLVMQGFRQEKKYWFPIFAGFPKHSQTAFDISTDTEAYAKADISNTKAKSELRALKYEILGFAGRLNHDPRLNILMDRADTLQVLLQMRKNALDSLVEAYYYEELERHLFMGRNEIRLSGFYEGRAPTIAEFGTGREVMDDTVLTISKINGQNIVAMDIHSTSKVWNKYDKVAEHDSKSRRVGVWSLDTSFVGFKVKWLKCAQLEGSFRCLKYEHFFNGQMMYDCHSTTEERCSIEGLEDISPAFIEEHL